MPGGYVSVDFADLVRSALVRRFGAGRYVSALAEAGLYLDHAELQKKRAGLDEVDAVAEAALLGAPGAHVARVYSARQLAQGIAGDMVDRAFVYGYYPPRSGDLMVAFEPYQMPKRPFEKRLSCHFSNG